MSLSGAWRPSNRLCVFCWPGGLKHAHKLAVYSTPLERHQEQKMVMEDNVVNGPDDVPSIPCWLNSHLKVVQPVT